MATFQKLKNGSVRAFIYVSGVRDSLTHPTMKQAKSWAYEREVELKKHKGLVTEKMTLGDLFQRYADEISPTKRGGDKEIVRINRFIREYETLCAIRLVNLQREDFENWMQQRLEEVMPSSVNRELNIINHVLNVAKTTWRLMVHSPLEGLRRPKDPPARTRHISVCH